MNTAVSQSCYSYIIIPWVDIPTMSPSSHRGSPWAQPTMVPTVSLTTAATSNSNSCMKLKKIKEFIIITTIIIWTLLIPHLGNYCVNSRSAATGNMSHGCTKYGILLGIKLRTLFLQGRHANRYSMEPQKNIKCIFNHSFWNPFWKTFDLLFAATCLFI